MSRLGLVSHAYGSWLQVLGHSCLRLTSNLAYAKPHLEALCAFS